MKAKSKGKDIIKGIKTGSKEYTVCIDPSNNELPKINFNPFKQDLILSRIALSDPLITEIQSIIDKELELRKLSDEELLLIIDIVNDRRIPDWRNLGWGIKCEMLRVCFEKSFK